MNFIKTKSEFEEMKKDFTQKIDSFLNDFNEFTRHLSPSYWRSTGKVFSELKTLKYNMRVLEPIQMKHLEQDWVRDEVLNDEEKEEYNTIKKYNL